MTESLRQRLDGRLEALRSERSPWMNEIECVILTITCAIVLAYQTCARVMNMANRIDLTGQRFDRLQVLRMTKSGARGISNTWLCRCDCGRDCEKTTSQLRKVGRIQVYMACQTCWPATRARSRRRHGGIMGGVREPLYSLWERMKDRCFTRSSTSWRWYGAKGIRVCDEWLDYAVFRTWALANGYEPGLSIEREKTDKNYEPGNCSFITRQENSRRARESERLARARPPATITLVCYDEVAEIDPDVWARLASSEPRLT